MKKVETFLKLLRESFDNAEEVYTRGSCVRLSMMLKIAFGGELMYDGDHACIKIEDKYYDITGEIDKGSMIPVEGNYNIDELMKLRYDVSHNK